MFFIHQPVQSVDLTLLRGISAKSPELHFSCQTVFEMSTFKIPGDGESKKFENDSVVGFFLLAKYCGRGTPFISTCLQFFFCISKFV